MDEAEAGAAACAGPEIQVRRGQYNLLFSVQHVQSLSWGSASSLALQNCC